MTTTNPDDIGGADDVTEASNAIRAAVRSSDADAFRTALLTHRLAVHRYLMSLRLEGAPADLTRSYVSDALDRFLHTLEQIPLPAGSRILELGGNPYFFHILLHSFLEDSAITAANFFDHNIFSTAVSEATHRVSSELTSEEWSFTYPVFNLDAMMRYPLPARSFELIFFCETLEHLIVNPLAVFRKIRRLLVPGGHVIITLPNAMRLSNVGLMLDGWNFFDLYHADNGIHGRHNREFTLNEMKALLVHNGFEICRAETRDRFDYEQVPIEALDYSGTGVLARRKAGLLEALVAAGGTTDDRGDNLYLLARRPLRELQTEPWPDGVVLSSRLPPSDPLRVIVYPESIRDEERSVTASGWAFLLDDDTTWTRLVLRSEESAFTAVCRRESRPDVAREFAIGVSDLGYRVTVSKAELPAGRYTLGVMLGSEEMEPAYRDLGISVDV